MSDRQFVIRTVESRRLLETTPIPWAEPAPPTAQGYPSFLEPVFYKRRDIKRTLQGVKLDQFTETPVGFAAGFYPASALAQSFHSAFSTKPQTLPILDEYPLTPVAAALTAFLAPAQFRRHQKRKHLAPIELNQFTVTPVGFADGFFPGSKLAESNRINFSTNLQRLPENNNYPHSGFFPGSALAKSFRTKFKRKLLQPLELDDYQTPLADSGFYPGSALAESFRIRFARKLQTPPELDQFTVTPVGFQDGFYPGSKLAESFRYSFNVKLQTLELGEYPLPAPAPEMTASLAPTQFRRHQKRKHLTVLELDRYRLPLFAASGFFPGSKLAESLHSKRKVRLQQFPELDSFDTTLPAFKFGFYPSFILEKANLTSFKAKLQEMPELNVYPGIVSSFTLTTASFGMTAQDFTWIADATWALTIANFTMSPQDFDVTKGWTSVITGIAETYTTIGKGASESYTEIDKGASESYTDIDKGKDP